MGRRKLRLSSVKNYERKKYQKHSLESCGVTTCNVTELIVRLPLSAYISSPVTTSDSLFERLHQLLLPSGWFFCVEEREGTISKSFDYGTVKMTINSESLWALEVGGNVLSLPSNTLPIFLTGQLRSCNQVFQILKNVDQSCLCIGNPDPKFSGVCDQRGGKFLGHSGMTVAYYDTRSLPSPTIRTSICCYFVTEGSLRCIPCDEYRSSLHRYASRLEKHSSKDASDPSSHVNYCHLSREEMVMRLHGLHKKNRALTVKVRRLQTKLEKAIETDSVVVDEETSLDFEKIMEQEELNITEKFSDDSFQSLFWNQQKLALSKTGSKKNGVRWHPMILRWCLYLRHQSSKAYETIRDSGCIALPSQRTLRDYSNAVKAEAGFSSQVDNQLLLASKLMTSAKYHNLIVVLIDEMHIREDLVYNKHTGKLVGFTDIGDINNHLMRFEKSLDSENTPPPLAKSMVSFMVKGLFTSLKFPYAQFPCVSLVGEQLFPLFWEAVFRLERIGFKVIATTFDGASVNRRLVALHDLSDKLVYKILNIHAEEKRYIYCFSDPPHLIKTVRNCFASKNRFLWNNGSNISWQHVVDLYKRDHGKGSGLSIVPKLKFEHIYINSFSKMRVDLAAQVLSETVGKAIRLTGGPETAATADFILIFDKFFDLLNVSNFDSWRKSRKPFQRPYVSGDDTRLKWLEETFLPYLDSWEQSVQLRQGYTKSQKNRMVLSAETLLGIRRTVKSFIKFIKYIFSMPEIKEHNKSLVFLSANICQDPLEGFFGCQRQRGGTHDNPSVQEFYNNTQALRVVDSFCRAPVKGNCRGRTIAGERTMPMDNTPLPRRRRHNST